MCKALLLVAHLWSIHTAPVPNNSNYGAGLECSLSESSSALSVAAGAFDNSYGNLSAYLGIGQNYKLPEASQPNAGKLSVGWFLLAATGYFGKPVIPVPGLTFSYEVSKIRLQVGVVPVAVKATPLHLTIAYRF